MDQKLTRILVVEDEPEIAELIKFNLSIENYDVVVCSHGEDVKFTLTEFKPDLILLDIMLPGINGLELCSELKSSPNYSNIPIIMLTAKSEEADIVHGLESGADDYITKPFSPQILLARTKSVLRRSGKKVVTTDCLKIHELEIHLGRHEVKLLGENVQLTQSEFQILYFLAKKPGWVFTRSQIVDAIRGHNYAVTERAIDFQMVGLRKKLGESSDYIETIRGIGYRFKE